jgi:hypothetical protein
MAFVILASPILTRPHTTCFGLQDSPQIKDLAKSSSPEGAYACTAVVNELDHPKAFQLQQRLARRS